MPAAGSLWDGILTSAAGSLCTAHSMIDVQGEQLTVATDCMEQTVENTVATNESLAAASTWQQKTRGLLFDISTIAVGTGLGTLGMLL